MKQGLTQANWRSSSSQAEKDDVDGDSTQEDCIIGQAMAYSEVYDRAHESQCMC